MNSIRLIILICACTFFAHNLFAQDTGTTRQKTLVQADVELSAEAVMKEIGNIYFDSGSYKLDDKSKFKLNRLVQILNDHPIFEILIVAHTDSRGSELYNKELSEKRGQITKLFFVEGGVSKNRIYLEAFGEKELKNECIDNVSCDEVLHHENRRVEFVIFSD